tara:strand:- start:516 stop:3245 length:2730 start_codon:yes stop_codon:yes gene_type:complete
MNPVISQNLENYRVSNNMHTHVSMISPKGKFQLNRQNLEKYWDIYSELLINNKDVDIISGVAEKPQNYLPVLVDVDLKIEDKNESIDKLYKDTHIISTIEIYQSILRNIIEDCSDDNLICIVLEKPLYKVRKNDKIFIKNGFHLQFPYTFLSKSDQEMQLIPRIRKKMKELKIFEDIIENCNIDNIIDKSYVKNPWLLYGSRKQVNLKSYKVTSVFDANCTQIGIEDGLSHYKIYNDKEEIIEFERSIEFYLPRILSIIPYGREVCELKNDISFPVNIQHLSIHQANSNNYQSNFSVEENLKLAKQLLEIISDERADNRNDWITIGWCLYNVSNGSDNGLKLWLEFSKKCPDKFDEKVCHYEWSKMIKKELDMGTLRWIAKKDNSKKYQKIVADLVKPHIKSSLQGSHNDIAKALWEMYGTQFVCSSYHYKTWYMFENHIWNQIEEGVFLRSLISETIVNKFEEIGQEAFSALKTATDEGEKAMHNVRITQAKKMMNNLKSAPYKNNVMKESMEVFYNRHFQKKLDSNKWLVAFQNGVYDLKANKFRDGLPTDYLSIQMGISYNKDLTYEDQSVKDVFEFLEKVFPDKSVRQYFMDTSSDVFVGGNANKHVIFWSGEGDNAKSVTQTIFEKMLGQYSVKLPTSLITGKRTASSAASPELVRAGNGVRWAVLQEPDQKDVINIGLLKELSGNDTFYARGLFQAGGEINPMFKLVLICNEPPQLPNSDKATWNRIRVIPFEATFCDDAPETYEEQLAEKRFPKDPHFASKIPAMLEAFAWVLLEHRKKITRRFEPEKVKMATANYRKKNDIYRQFIEECIIECEKSTISLTELYSQFKEWFRDSLPNYSLPIKNEVKEYFVRLWGSPEKRGFKWVGYRIKTIQDELDTENTIILNENDLVDYSNKNNVPDL